jgi:hypothetical protein
MKRTGILLLSIFSAVVLLAEDTGDGDFELSHHRASVSGMLTSSDTWQVQFGYHYMLNRYVGVGGSVGSWQVYYENGYADGGNWSIDDDSKPGNIYLHPSVVFKSPALRIKNIDLGLYAEPGMMMNIPYKHVWIREYTDMFNYELKSASTTKGQWLGVDVKIGVYANIGQCGLSAGYIMSNFDAYSQYRHLSYNGVSFDKFYPKKSFMRGAYLTASYYF